MRALIVFAGLLVPAVQVCSAAACTGGTLADYLALGSAGCTIGANTVSGFQNPPGITGAAAIPDSAIAVAPGGGTNNPFLMFSTSQTASTGTLLESIFTFDISGPSYVSSSISLTGSSETVDGAVTDIENFCAGGSFGSDGVTGCSGTPGSLLALYGFQNSDQSSFGPVSFLNVTNDFTLDGGTAGSASGGVFTDSFAAPEPASLLLAVLGITFLAALKRTK